MLAFVVFCTVFVMERCVGLWGREGALGRERAAGWKVVHTKYLDILSFHCKQVKVIFERVFLKALFLLGYSINCVFKDRWGTDGIFSLLQERETASARSAKHSECHQLTSCCSTVVPGSKFFVWLPACILPLLTWDILFIVYKYVNHIIMLTWSE